MVSLNTVRVDVPEGLNVIVGQSHFIKTVPDLYEILVSSSPALKFGIAFSEASGHRLVRPEGNDEDLEKRAADTPTPWLRPRLRHIPEEGFPINVLNAIKGCQEVCTIFCATANPWRCGASSEQGNGVMGVIDGTGRRHRGCGSRAWRRLLRKFGYSCN
jgi:adenosine/AMP kinase